jgi:predicted enzyme related to lactoylglutathione lyase
MIFASDHDAMVAFYREAFGLTVDTAASSPGYTVLTGDGGGIRLSIHALPPDVVAEIGLTDPPRPRIDTAFKLLFEVPDLPAAVDRLAALGARFFDTAEDGAADGIDVEGNMLRLHVASS